MTDLLKIIKKDLGFSFSESLKKQEKIEFNSFRYAEAYSFIMNADKMVKNESLRSSFSEDVSIKHGFSKAWEFIKKLFQKFITFLKQLWAKLFNKQKKTQENVEKNINETVATMVEDKTDEEIDEIIDKYEEYMDEEPTFVSRKMRRQQKRAYKNHVIRELKKAKGKGRINKKKGKAEDYNPPKHVDRNVPKFMLENNTLEQLFTYVEDLDNILKTIDDNIKKDSIESSSINTIRRWNITKDVLEESKKYTTLVNSLDIDKKLSTQLINVFNNYDKLYSVALAIRKNLDFLRADKLGATVNMKNKKYSSEDIARVLQYKSELGGLTKFLCKININSIRNTEEKFIKNFERALSKKQDIEKYRGTISQLISMRAKRINKTQKHISASIEHLNDYFYFKLGTIK